MSLKSASITLVLRNGGKETLEFLLDNITECVCGGGRTLLLVFKRLLFSIFEL